MLESDIKHDVKTFNAISSSILEAFKQSSPADPLTVASQIFLVYSYMTAAEQQPDDVTWHHLLVACRLMGGENLSATETIKYFLKQYRKQGSMIEVGKLYDYIKKFVRKVYGTSAFCAPFGSSVNGLGLSDADSPGIQAQPLFHARTPIIKLNTSDGVQADIALQVPAIAMSIRSSD
ncbi:hypothetical protein GUITHDRAFT_99764 [Guillardia theta CCMP2712]|uniref:Uncharacterized protein n=1 Tax=Guillardia theta (strain CCMP2712) TaxID=905079 RepID=L1K1R6_GUITC|nr:hypothetical protein GUITHDRAFT_99764 [Guillardia theta CCMP2712]EKX54288.1 hypothetical protein GUITHDRAFT_99764 [Guillardia theta CCMP2712]|eukprot:XP_005841268.1 hypothetical protein GUITHDRAFT_99764 [Guillardia theta CCMP2712]